MLSAAGQRSRSVSQLDGMGVVSASRTCNLLVGRYKFRYYQSRAMALPGALERRVAKKRHPYLSNPSLLMVFSTKGGPSR